jgi:predicted esterase
LDLKRILEGMTSYRYFVFLAALLPAFASAQTIHYDSGYTWRGYTGTVAPTCPSKLCHYFHMITVDPFYAEYTAWKSSTDNPNTASAFVNFRVIFPLGYNKNDTTRKYPVIVMFHGAGESGRIYNKHYDYVPTDSTYDNNSHQLKSAGNQHKAAVGKIPSNNGSFPGIVVFPQASYNGAWSDSTSTVLSEHEKMLVGFIEDHLVTEYHADINRIVAHGLSNGAKSLWALAQKRPDLFAAILPMSGVPNNSTVAANILVTTPIRLFQGGLDTNPSPGAAKQTINAFIAKGGTPEYFLYEDLGHGTWNRAYSEPDFFMWIRARDKRQIHVFGGNTELCSNPIKLGFSANMISYQWTRNGADIAGANGRFLENVTQPGTYHVKFQRPNGQWDDSFAVNITQSTDCSPARPVLSTNLNATVCSQLPGSITLDDDGGVTSAATFNITAINFNGLTPIAGSPAIGNGFYNVEIFDDAYLNKGTAPIGVVYTVVPVSSDGIAGDPRNVVLTVNPEPTLSTALSGTQCSDVPSGIILDDNGAGVNATAFDITAINFNGLAPSAGAPITSTGLPATSISDDAYTNTTPESQNVVYSVIPKSSAGCGGQSADITLAVLPEPVMSSALDATVGTDQPSGIVLDDNGSGVNAASFNITQINFNGLTASTGSPSVGNGFQANVISDDAYTNSSQSPVSVIYTVQPKSDRSCIGNVTNIVLTVSPVTPIGENQNVTRCSDVASGIILTGNAGGVQASTFDITGISFDGLTASAGNPSTGNGLNAQVVSDDAYTNKTASAKNVVYTFVPVSSTGVRGESAVITLTVNPEPVLKQVAAVQCSGVASAIILDDDGSGENAASFNITAIDFNALTPAAGAPVTGTDLPATAISDDAYSNQGSTDLEVLYSVVPVSSNACPGDSGPVTFTVLAEPVLSSTLGASVLSDETSGIILDDNGLSANATAFQITNIELNGLTASAGEPTAGDNLPSTVISDDAFTNATEQPVNVVYSVIPISQQNCRGIAGTVTLTVDPKPAGDDGDSATTVDGFQNNEQAVFPNPTSGKVTVRTGDPDFNGPVMVFTATGQLMFAETRRAIDGTIELDLSTLSSGFYILRCGALIAKIVKE